MSVFLMLFYLQTIVVVAADFLATTGKISGFRPISILLSINCKINAKLDLNLQFSDTDPNLGIYVAYEKQA